MSFRWIASALALCLSAGCAIPVRAPSAPAFDPSAGAVLVYLEPPPAEARRLTASLATLEAVREDGGRIPLRLANPSVGGNLSLGPHRLASGSLPPGRYAGLEVTLSEATLADEEGQAALGLPDGPTRVPLPFAASAGSGTVVEMQLDLKAALADGYRFQPAFAATIPAPIPVGLVGLASLPEEGLVVTFDRRSGRVTAVTPVGRRPVGIAIDAVRRRGYVALAGDDALVAIDLERGTVAERRPLRGGDQPVDLALTDGGRVLVVANEGSSSVSFVESTGLAETGRAIVGDAPVAVLLDRTGQRVFVACRRANRIDELGFDSRRREWQVVRSVATDPGPFRLQFNRAGSRLYAAQDGSPYAIAFDADTLAVAQRPFVGPGQTAIRVDPASDRIYLARRGTGTIEVFDPFSLLAIDRLPIPGDAAFLTIDRENAGIVAVLSSRGEVVRVSPLSRGIEATVPAGPSVAFAALIGER
jgi:DNA-binding beta-propeller fold protein YncE